MKIFKISVSLLFYSLVITHYSSLFSYQKLSCIIHLHSNYSHNVNQTLEDLIIKAREKKIDVIIPTDHYAMAWEYTPLELLKIFSKKIEMNSVLKLGPENYLIDILKLQSKYEDIIIIPGLEVAPYYTWSGSISQQNLTINNWHRHMLVVGLKNPDDYRKLPSMPNSPAGKFNPIMLWPSLLIIFGYKLLTQRKQKVVLGIVIFIVGIIFLYGNYPFESCQYDPHKSSFLQDPYQKMIDYVNSKGGLIFWAHPEATNWEKPQKIGPVYVKTSPYPELLKETKNYTGFAIFAEGFKKVGTIGGIWDKILLEYCNGKRERPVWAISELDYGEGFGEEIDILQNVLFAKSKSESDILTSFKNGNFYALSKSKDYEILLDEFYITDGKNKAIFGDTIKTNAPLKIFMDIKTSGNIKKTAKISIIKDGKLLNTIETSIPNKIYYHDLTENNKKSYIRVFIDAGYPNYIATNPVFVCNRAAAQ